MILDLTDLPRLLRNSARLRKVLSVAIRYEVAPWLRDIRIDWLQRQFRTQDGAQIGDLPMPVRIRKALTELGTTFIKLGQILSTRADLVGPELAEELAHLQSSTPADDPEVVREIIRSELGKPPEELFRSFHAVAFASASIGQVHHAVLHDGTNVVVKVQHAGIESKIRNDLEILIELAGLAEAHSSQAAPYRPVAIATEFKRTLMSELDFTREQRNMQRFDGNFDSDKRICFARPYPEFCSRRVLTMDCLNGISVSDQSALTEAGYDLADVARRGADMFLQMVFRDGFYHADPHPGNLLILPDQKIGVLDCGMVGRVDDHLRDQVEDLLLAAVDQDADRLLDVIEQLGQLPIGFDRERLRSEMVEFVDEYGPRSMDQFDLGGALNGMTSMIRNHHIVLPTRVSLLIKMLVMLEGTARQLSPDFSIVELLESYRSEAIKRRLSPQRLYRKLRAAQRDWTRLVEAFPGDVSDIMNRVRRGSFDINLQHRRLDTIVNRLVLGILAAALFIGSSALWASNVRPLVFGASVPGALGCTAAALMGAILVRAIRNSGDL